MQMSTSLSMILTFYITQFYLLKINIYYRYILKTLFQELASLLYPWCYLWSFRIFQNNHPIKNLDSASSVLSLLLSKLLLVTTMVEKWKVCQIKNISVCVLPLLPKYYCYFWKSFWWISQGNYVVNYIFIDGKKLTCNCTNTSTKNVSRKVSLFSKITWRYRWLLNLSFRSTAYDTFVFFRKRINKFSLSLLIYQMLLLL